MLTDRPTAETIRQAVHAVVREVCEGCSVVSDADRLSVELGLRSLDLARLVALLESRLGADPFAELVSVTSVRTVGDIVNAYERLFRGDVPGHEDDQKANRSRARLEARAHRR